MKKILLSFDVEEFDLPLEYGHQIPQKQQFEITYQGLENILELLDSLNIAAAFFTTASFAKKYPDKIKEISEKHEIASHGDQHSSWDENVPARSKEKIENIIGKKIYGFRRARLQKVNYTSLYQAGYMYDSSINPIFLPGRYNNLSFPRTAHKIENILEIPISTTPLIRFPLFWLSFKNLPLSMINAASLWTLKTDGCLNIFFHPWEFTDLSSFKIPNYIKKPDNKILLNKLASYLESLKKHGDYFTLSSFTSDFSL